MACALSHGWLTDLKTGNEDSGSDRDHTAQSRGESTRSRKRKFRLATHDRQRKRRSGRNPITSDDTRRIPADVALDANAISHCGDDPTTPKAVANTCGDNTCGDNTIGRSSCWELGSLNKNSEARIDATQPPELPSHSSQRI